VNRVLVDTNIWAYLLGIGEDTAKREILIEVFKKLAEEEWQVFICSQVCKEFVRVGTEKYGYTGEYMEHEIERLKKIANVIYEDCEDVRTAIELREHYNLQFWDAVVVAVAINNRIPYILTEDITYRIISFKDQQVELIDPFDRA